MNYRQLTKVLLLLSCFISHAFAGLLPGGNTGGSGYQYNRPGGTGFGGVPGTFTGGDLGRGSDFGGGFKRPTTLYGAPGSGGDIGFGGRPSTAYGIPGQFGGGGGGSGSYQDAGYGQDNGRPQPYSFQYEVYDPPSGNDYSQRESSDGNVVQGEYRVLLPDSRTQIVKYMADDANGYTADVQYEGQAQFSRGGIGSGAYGTPGQTGAGGYQGDAGVFGGTSGQFGGPTASNQYLPPRNNYRK